MEIENAVNSNADYTITDACSVPVVFSSDKYINIIYIQQNLIKNTHSFIKPRNKMFQLNPALQFFFQH